MGTKGKLLIIALLMSGIVALLVWSKNGNRKPVTPPTGVAGQGGVDPEPIGEPHRSMDTEDGVHPQQGGAMPAGDGRSVDTASSDGRTPPVVDSDTHPPLVKPPAPAASAKTYVVEANDSLAKIALKVYGKEKYWKQIFEANKDKMSSADDLLRVGTSLVMPVIADTKPPADTVQAPKNDPPVANHDAPPTPPADTAKKTYKVKAGDTLSSIAKATLGDPNKWKSIYLANKEKLANPDSLTEGMELNLP